MRWGAVVGVALFGCNGSDVDIPFDAGPDAGGDGRLTSLEITAGGVAVTLDPAFDPETFEYSIDLRLADAAVEVTATADLAIEIDRTAATSGEARSIDVALGPSAIAVVVTDDSGNRLYQIDVARGAGVLERARVDTAELDPGDGFGEVVALSGDTMIVGAPHEASNATGIDGDETDDSALDSGAAYIFVRDGAGGWQQQAYLKASITDIGDLFGSAVAIDGDRAVVGAPGEDSADPVIDGDQDDDNALGAGAVYVFVRNGTTWTQDAYLKADNAEAGDNLGTSVAISGDTVVTGAPLEDGVGNAAASSGAAYVFVDAGGWQQQAIVRANNAESGDLFAGSVSVDGDRLAAGAVAEASAGALSGGAYVFSRTDQSWSQDDFLVASNTAAGDNFGASVAISGATLAVGAFAEDSGAIGVGGDESDDTIRNSGAVYVFVDAGGWSQQAYLKASNTNSNDQFGGALSIDGEVLVIGAASESGDSGGVNGDQSSNNVNDAGAVYLYVRAGASWSLQAYVKPTGPAASALFGSGLAVDGFGFVAGAPGEGATYGFD